MITNISRVDESFTDFHTESKFDTNISKLIGNLVGIQPEPSKSEEIATNFTVYFDIALYIAPPVIVRLEEK